MALDRIYEKGNSTYIKAKNPANQRPLRGNDNKILEDLVESTPEKVREEVSKLTEAQEMWAREPLWMRGEYLMAFKEEVYRNSELIASIVTQEVGKPLVESLTEVLVSLDCLGYYAKKTPRLLAPNKYHGTNPVNSFKKLETVYRPKGVIAAIEPWNFPFMLPMIAVTQIIAGGNAAIIKPSTETPYSSVLIGEMAAMAWRDVFGMSTPPIISVVPGHGPTSRAVVDEILNDNIADLHFTGSVEVGKMLYQKLAGVLKNPVLELGGKDALIVCDDADVRAAAKTAVASAFYNAGQVCESTERVYVTRKNADRFLEHVLDEVRAIRLGVGTNPEVGMGPLISQSQIETVEDHIQDAVSKGAKVLYGGSRLTGAPYDNGTFFEPTVLTGVDHKMKVMKEENFGPIMPIMVVEDESELLALANDSIYGLTGSVWTKDIAKGKRMAAEMEVGVAYVNDTLWAVTDPRAVWKGAKWSGINASNGMEGFLHVVESKTISLNEKPLYLPDAMVDTWKKRNSSAKTEFFRAAIELLHGGK